MLSDKTGNKIVNYVPDYVVFDLETTGTSSANDAVIEISAVKVKNGKVVDEFTSLVNPMRHIPIFASEVNGIYDDMVKDAPVFKDVLKQFIGFIGDEVLVGHNIQAFDLKFIYRDAMEYFGKTIDNDYIDTLLLSKKFLDSISRHRLVDLAKHYNISAEGAHRALNDCRMNQKIFECLAKEIEQNTDEDSIHKKCPKCGSLLKLRNGKFGEFYGCLGFPACRYTENC